MDGMYMPDWGPPSRHRQVFSTGAERVRWETVEWRNLIATAELAQSFGMDRHVCLLTRAVWEFHYRRGNAGVLIRLNKAALAAAQRLGDTGLTAMAHNYLAGAHARGGQLAQSRPHLDQALALWRAAGDTTAVVVAALNLMTVDMASGRFDAAIARGHQIVEQSTEAAGKGEPERRRLAINRVKALRMLGECHVALGRYRTALGYLRQAARQLAHLTRSRDGYYWAWTVLVLGQVHARLGHRVTAPLLLRRALAVFEQSGNETLAAESLVELGIIHLRAGDLYEARRLHEWAVERTERASTPLGYSQMLNRLGVTLLRSGDAASAEARHREALAIAQRVEYRYEEAVAHIGLAAALSTVDPEASDRHTREGSRLFAAMGAVDPYHLADDSPDCPSGSAGQGGAPQ
jgi:tetratricopeptide (TPR) repeat protein